MTAITERSYTTMDKSSWGAGRWQDEPDKIQFVDEATGLDCLIVRSHLGALCGYVGVAEGHPLFGVEYGDGPDDQLDVHGGITYSDACQVGPEAESVCHIPAPGQPDHLWWFGFDCAHLGDLCPAHQRRRDPIVVARGIALGEAAPPAEMFVDRYRDVDYVRAQCASLARQLADLAAPQLPAPEAV